MRVGSLFAGIGGFDLGFERAGMQTAWQVELDPYCRAVLAQHFPDAERFEDVREVGGHNLEPVDLICGGFPCTDLSIAGRGAGLDGDESGLWSEYARVIRELRPRYIVVENVPDLLVRGKRWDRAPVGRVLGDLAAIGYDAEWSVLSAAEFGAPHLRERIWLVAYPQQQGLEGLRAVTGQPEVSEPRNSRSLADPSRNGEARSETSTGAQRERVGASSQRSGGVAADQARTLDDPGGRRHGASQRQVRAGRDGIECPGWWGSEPGMGRVAHGIPNRVDRLAALGNALVPQIAEFLGRRILDYEKGSVT